jgi:hypothetical protein
LKFEGSNEKGLEACEWYSVAMHRTWNLEGGGFAGQLKGDNMEDLELESSDAEGVGLEGAQLGSSEGGKIAEAEVEGSNGKVWSSRAHSLRA